MEITFDYYWKLSSFLSKHIFCKCNFIKFTQPFYKISSQIITTVPDYLIGLLAFIVMI